MKHCAKSCKMEHKHKMPLKKIKRAKVKKIMREYKEDKLHSGSKHGPMVHKRDQAIAIALSEGRKAEKKASKRRQKKAKKAHY